MILSAGESAVIMYERSVVWRSRRCFDPALCNSSRSMEAIRCSNPGSRQRRLEEATKYLEREYPVSTEPVKTAVSNRSDVNVNDA